MEAERFVGRVRELKLQGEFLARPSPGIAVIYGRRWIGKSLLIPKALEGRRALTFEGLENQAKRAQIDAFLFQLAQQGRGAAAGGAASNWLEALGRLGPLFRKRPTCLVLDEFQWLANYRRDLVSDLKMIWERSLSKIPGAKLLRCGSVASFMTTKVVRSSALYGRIDLELHLQGFHLDETRELLQGKGLDEVIEASLYFDGVPKYLDLVRAHPSVLMGVESRLIKYMLSDAYMRFCHAFIRPNLRKIRSGAHRDLFARLRQTGRFHTWRGRAFEHLCLAHARRIAETLGFSGIDFSVGPYFRAPRRGNDGLQMDLLFSRADNVISLCEMKCSVAPIGIGVAKEVERKVELLHAEFPSKTIQRVLVVHGHPSRELAQSGYFYRIIKAAELAS